MIRNLQRYRTRIITCALVAMAALMFGAIASKQDDSPTQTDSFFNIKPVDPVSLEVNPETCEVDFQGVKSEKRGDICAVMIDRQVHPYVYANGGSCNGINTTSPATSDILLAIELKKEIFRFNFPQISDEDLKRNDINFFPSLHVRGIAGDGFEDCLALPADAN